MFANNLIKIGADINQLDNEGSPPLFTAIRVKNIEMLKELLNNSALDKNIQNNYGKNAIAIALQAHPKDNELMITLINQGINPFAEDINGNSPYSIMKKYESGEITKGGNKLNIEPVIQEIDKLHGRL
jgi:ankyrin repeat protein